MAASDRPAFANRDGVYEGIGEVPEAQSVHPKQRYVVRLDLDGPSALGIISGDIYVGPTLKTYEASFITRQAWAKSPQWGNGDDGFATGPGRTFEGIAELHGWSSKTKIWLRLFLPDESDGLPRLELRRRFLLSQFPRIYPTYRLDLTPVKDVFPQFRRIELDVAYEAALPPLGVFYQEADAVPRTVGEDRLPTVEQAFADAGIRIATSIARQRLDESEAAVAIGVAEPDRLWNDEELHAAMQELGNGGDVPGWRVSLLVVSRHVNQALAGLMFDSNLGLPRQGAAVFVDRLNEIQGSGAEAARQRLHTVVHEIGHTLNLLHCFQADRSELYRGRARPEALTWMNYPHLYPNGEAQPNLSEWYDESRANYWSHFGYRFDRDELTHLRHSSLHMVMIGGGIESFMKQSSRETELLSPSVSSGLELDLALPGSVDFLQQIEGYARLYNRAPKGRQIHEDLSPSAGTLTIAVRRRGAPRVVRHWRVSCVPRLALRVLDPGGKAYEPLTLNFGDRWYVDEPGIYDFQAVYQPPDGTPAVSPVRQVRVGRPWSREAERQAADFFCNEVGLYLGLNGSRSDGLKATAQSLDDLAQRFAGRSIGTQIRRATNLMSTRPLKRPNRPALFDADRARAAAQALDAHFAQAQQGGATPKPLNPHLSCESIAAATGWARVGAKDQAHHTLVRLAAFLRSVGAPPQVLRIPQNVANQWHLKPIDP